MTRARFLVLGAALAVSACATTQVVSAPGPSRGASASTHILGIPPGHLPRPEMCCVWIPGRPPGQQARATACRGIAARAPAGSWILHRPSGDRRVVHVRVVDPRRPGVVVVIRRFEVDSGRFLDERAPRGDGDEDEPDDRGRGGRGRGP